MDLISLIWNLVIWQIFTVAIIAILGIGIFKPIQIQVNVRVLVQINTMSIIITRIWD